MKKLVTLIVAIGLLSITSCKESKKVEEASRMEHVMAIHDEVMPKMGTLGKLVGQLKPMADSLGVESAEAKAMKDLQEANRSMMDWMQGFGDRFDSEEIMKGKELSDEKKEWLKEEEEKVQQVKENINSSIKRAEEILSKQ
ncbi:hypothetical protein [Maribacter hydrothermalis]|uniref:Viral A-type inclusion protein n=1 Tax=Maribacter hydrothermalis TaxID=1836467 RepID=A0A1B7Z3N0_9FLAO|nr:hypothetical protein [Maribacter hydrothermalis]APQ17062.1 hypothetical protein BTR34_06875 [Maribacter hydrothermalis]OBR37323.1 hypothetical protein A9200_06630 [Maribacter hydrothermalis]